MDRWWWCKYRLCIAVRIECAINTYQTESSDTQSLLLLRLVTRRAAVVYTAFVRKDYPMLFGTDYGYFDCLLSAVFTVRNNKRRRPSENAPSAMCKNKRLAADIWWIETGWIASRFVRNESFWSWVPDWMMSGWHFVHRVSQSIFLVG